jgi:hypothetical protein
VALLKIAIHNSIYDRLQLHAQLQMSNVNCECHHEYDQHLKFGPPQMRVSSQNKAMIGNMAGPAMEF